MNHKRNRRIRLAVFLAVTVFWHSGCRRQENVNPSAKTTPSNQHETSAGKLHGGEINATEFKRRKQIDRRTQFQRLPSQQTGIALVHRFPESAPIQFLADQNSGAGIALGDYDADGLPDIYVTNYDQGNRLYRNLGNLRFEDVTTESDVAGKHRWCGGACFVDVDNDADLDLCVCAFNAPNLLYINQGDGTFENQAAQRGFDIAAASVMSVFADYDLDGDLDAYLVTHRLNLGDKFSMPRNTAEAAKRGILRKANNALGVAVTESYRELFQLMDRGEGRIELVICGQRDYLLENDGTGHFTIANEKAGIFGTDIGLAAIWWDYDSDGLPDLYVSNDYKGYDKLFHNIGDGKFIEVAKMALPHLPWFSMGSAIGDINNDGRMDLLATDMSGSNHFKQKLGMGDMQKEQWFLKIANPPQYMRNSLFLNSGTSKFMEISQLAGVANTDWTWSPLFGDLDNDGWIDLFVTNGMSRDYMDSDLVQSIRNRQGDAWRVQPIRKEPNIAFRNTGDLRFANVSQQWGLNHIGASYGAAVSDLDRDGDLDLVVANFEEELHLYENCVVGKNSIAIQLKGRASNKFGVGSKVDVETVEGTQTRWVTTGQGFMSSGEAILHFGVGSADEIRNLTVRWPSGEVQSFANLPANRLYALVEDASHSRAMSPDAEKTTTWFRQVDAFANVQHIEKEFNDFRLQPLLPAKQSQLGPGLAVSDVNSDNVLDLFLSGAAGQSGQLLDGKTRKWISLNTISARRECEQLGALFFDCDGDGDRDLYVVSGGVEVPPGHEALGDSLFLNDGHGSFVDVSANWLPSRKQSGSCVCAADYDRDGDLDLFVGAKVVPGQYPLSTESYLLRNEGDRFGHVLIARAQLGPIGRVTGALWTDADADGWIDLLITQHWGPIRFFRNDQGELTEETERAGISEITGWWNAISGGDLDADGDIDYVVTNQGLNTKYHASKHRPTLLYYGDFDGSGRNRIVEAIDEDGTLYPDRGRSCTTAAIPSLASRFPSFRDFASATLDEVYTAKSLQDAKRFAANTLESGMLLNDGNGVFKFRALPRLAQAAPAHGVVIQDVDGDGNQDIYLVHNDFSSQLETGRMDGGLGLLLHGLGDGRFQPVWPDASGLIVTGDARALSVIDLNGDAAPDFLVGINDGRILAFQNQLTKSKAFAKISLIGPSPNRDAIGARLNLTFSDGQSQLVEIYAGNGYLSQSTTHLFVGTLHRRLESILVRWPNGETTSQDGFQSTKNIVLRHE